MPLKVYEQPHEFSDPAHLPRHKLALALGDRLGFRAAPIRRSFVRRDDKTAPVPRLVQLVQGGRAGDVRLKLFLSALWISSEEPYDTAMPARTWATLTGLSDPEGAGARRVSDAIAWLEDNRFLKVQRRPGRLTKVWVLDEINGATYTSPVDDLAEAADADEPFPERDRYFRLAASFWTNGWIAQLSGVGVATLLTMLDLEPIGMRTESGRTPSRRPFWISPRRAVELYGLSASTRQRGLAELRRQKLLVLRPLGVTSRDETPRRARHAYQIDHERLKHQPTPLRPPPSRSRGRREGR